MISALVEVRQRSELPKPRHTVVQDDRTVEPPPAKAWIGHHLLIEREALDPVGARVDEACVRRQLAERIRRTPGVQPGGEDVRWAGIGGKTAVARCIRRGTVRRRRDPAPAAQGYRQAQP